MKFKGSLIFISILLVLFISLGSISAANADALDDVDALLVDSDSNIAVENTKLNAQSDDGAVNLLGGRVWISAEKSGSSIKVTVGSNDGPVPTGTVGLKNAWASGSSYQTKTLSNGVAWFSSSATDIMVKYYGDSNYGSIETTCSLSAYGVNNNTNHDDNNNTNYDDNNNTNESSTFDSDSLSVGEGIAMEATGNPLVLLLISLFTVGFGSIRRRF